MKYTGKYVRINGKTYKEIWLPQEEYAPVEHAMSTYVKQNNIKNTIVTIIFPDLEGKYYNYRAVIDRNGTPTFIKKEILK